MKRIVIAFILSLVAFGAMAATPAKLTSIDVKQESGKTILDIMLVGTPDYKVFSLNNPDRIVVDLSGTSLATTLKSSMKNEVIAAIRNGRGTSPAAEKNLRLVLDLKQPVKQENFVLAVEKSGSERLIIELSPQKSSKKMKEVAKPLSLVELKSTTKKTPPPLAELKSASAKQEGLEKKSAPRERVKKVVDKADKEIPEPSINVPDAAVEQDSPPKFRRSSPRRPIVVVIDPGHGGKDPGAIGKAGTREKDVVLAISRKLQVAIEKQSGMRAVLTRRGDYFIGLRQRLRLARKDRADMFIAIHADAYRNPQSSGASVFALSASGASSEAARWLAAKENYSELGGIALEDKGDVLRSVLLDLSQTATISLSLQLGSSLLQELGKIARLHHAGVEQARFVVLKSPDIPSVLVETGFLSNTKEERLLRDPAYQQRLANALSAGIRRYFMQNAPPGTVFAMEREMRRVE